MDPVNAIIAIGRGQCQGPGWQAEVVVVRTYMLLLYPVFIELSGPISTVPPFDWDRDTVVTILSVRLHSAGTYIPMYCSIREYCKHRSKNCVIAAAGVPRRTNVDAWILGVRLLMNCHSDRAWPMSLTNPDNSGGRSVSRYRRRVA